MLSTSRILLLQCQLLLLEKGVKEYSADWLENTNTVMRDAGGRFATKAKTSIEETKNSAKSLAQGVEITSGTVQSLVKDKAFRERAGLATGLAAANVVKSVAALVKSNPKVEAKIDQYITENQQQLSDIYGDDKSPFGQALRKTDDLQPPKDATFSQKLEFQVARYKALDEVIKSPKYANQDKEKQQELLGNLVKYGVPIATSFAVALAPELLLPLVLEGTIDLGAALTSAALGAGVDVGTNAVLDKAGVENPVIRIVAGLLSGAAAAGVVSGSKAVLGKRAASVAKEKNRIAAIATRLQKKGELMTEADDAAKAAWERMGIDHAPSTVVQSKGHDQHHDYSFQDVINSEKNNQRDFSGKPFTYPVPGVGEVVKDSILGQTQQEKGKMLSFVISRKDSSVQFDMIGGFSGRKDFRNRKVRNNFSITLEDVVNEVDFVRKLAIAAIEKPKELAEAVENSIKFVGNGSEVSKNEWSVNQSELFEGIEKVISDIKLLSSKIPNPNLKTETISTDSLEKLAQELKEHSLPTEDGVLIASSEVGLMFNMEKYKVWRGLGKQYDL